MDKRRIKAIKRWIYSRRPRGGLCMIDALDILVEDGSVDSWRLAAKHNCSPQYARRILRFMERCRILEGKRVGMRQMEYYLAPDNQQPPRTKQPKLISKKEQSEEDYAERREACFSQDSPKKSRRCPHVWEPNAQMRYGSFVIKPHFPFWRDIARLAREKLGSNNAAGVFVRFVTSRKYTIEQCLHLLKALVHQLKTATRKVTRAYFTWLIRRFDIGGFKKARRKGQRSRFETRIGIATIATIAQIMTCPTNATPAMIVERPYMQRSVEQQQKQPVNSPSIEEKPLAEIDERELLDADTYREYCRLKQAIEDVGYVGLLPADKKLWSSITCYLAQVRTARSINKQPNKIEKAKLLDSTLSDREYFRQLLKTWCVE